jgi:hypothetical protein
VSVHKGSNFSRKDAKAPRKKYQYVFTTMTYTSAIFASWREFFLFGWVPIRKPSKSHHQETTLLASLVLVVVLIVATF